MKLNNLFKGLVATLLVVGAASCSNEEMPEIKNDGNVTFSAVLADLPQTRAYADGKSAVNLKCAVYENGNLILTKDATFQNLTTNVTLQLLSDAKYDIVFFAYRDAKVYDFDTATGEVTVDYTKMNLDNVDDDCFYWLEKDFVAGSTDHKDVIMKRPVAQINFGTNDLDAYVVKNVSYKDGVNTQISFNAYKTMNLLTGEAEGDEEMVTLTKMAVNDAMKAETFPVEGGYTYMAMGYAFVPETGSVTNISLGAFNGEATESTNAILINDAPLKRNHRTNIYGSLLTSTSKWSITIDNGWAGIHDITDYTNDEALKNGGLVKVENEVEEMNIPKELTAPLVLNVNAKIGKLTIGDTDQPVTINVAKDVDYPTLEFVKNSTIKGLSIIGDKNSSK